MPQDWKGNSRATFTTLGASSHALEERETYDYYATEPKALELLLKLEQFSNVWECAAGGGHLSEVLIKHGIYARGSDIINRGYCDEEYDFLSIDNQ